MGPQPGAQRDPEPVDLDLITPEDPSRTDGPGGGGRGIGLLAAGVALALVIAGASAIRRHGHDAAQPTPQPTATSSSMDPNELDRLTDTPARLAAVYVDSRESFRSVVLNVMLTNFGNSAVTFLGLRGAPPGFVLSGLDRGDYHDLDHPAVGPLINPLVIDTRTPTRLAISYARTSCPTAVTSDPVVLAADVLVPGGQRTVPVSVYGLSANELFGPPTPDCRVVPPHVVVPRNALLLSGTGTRTATLSVDQTHAQGPVGVTLACVGDGPAAVGGLIAARIPDCAVDGTLELVRLELHTGRQSVTVTAPKHAAWTLAIYRPDLP